MFFGGKHSTGDLSDTASLTGTEPIPPELDTQFQPRVLYLWPQHAIRPNGTSYVANR